MQYDEEEDARHTFHIPEKHMSMLHQLLGNGCRVCYKHTASEFEEDNFLLVFSMTSSVH